MTMVGRDRHERQDHHHVPAGGGLPRRRACRPGVIGTTGARVGGERPCRSRARRRRPPTCTALLARMRADGVQAVAMEVSSHALDQHRVGGVRVRRGGVHEPDPGPPRLPRVDGGLLRREGGAVHARARAGAVVERRRPLGRRLLEARRRSRRDPSRWTRSADLRADGRGRRRRGLAFRVGDDLESGRGSADGSTSRTASARSASRSLVGHRSETAARGDGRGAPASPGGWSRSTRGRTSWWSWITRTRRIASGTCCGRRAR